MQILKKAGRPVESLRRMSVYYPDKETDEGIAIIIAHAHRIGLESPRDRSAAIRIAVRAIAAKCIAEIAKNPVFGRGD